ncbi:MAG TPA: hypothetical protein DIW07_07550 [Lachnospiraceae bacterium]|jgi:glycosyltransferase involved in cell wall biosynthesis|uniref:glycosyltransferase family 4 protein n=1 Tax=Muricomes intestini TaxID=1796634 RepID=UPI000E9DBC9A|nr:hypothetical protein [Lachnospiraceae bacterium]HCR83255.1 hypothetical protein [Lachnospiraceae bacterium]
MIKILFYSWDYLEGNYGGGVSVYLRNLISVLSKNGKYECSYLNAGLTYTSDHKMKIRDIHNENTQIKCYELINSPVLAPVRQSIKNVENYLNDQSMHDVVKDFISKHDFDIIHFNNLEGLSLSVLNLKKVFPKVKFIYSVHNYFPVCTRTNLWKDELSNNAHNCDKKSFEECANCYEQINYRATVFQRIHRGLPGMRTLAGKYSKIFPDHGNLDSYQQFEEVTIQSINENMDIILAVSERVKEILVRSGINADKTYVSYIGTKAAEIERNKCTINPYQDYFQLIYMGYMRPEKGFYFFIDALEHMDENISNKVNIRIVVRYGKENSNEVTKIEKLKTKFHKVELVNGYNKDNQCNLLEDVNLGVVPVLWEDNLPQVAIEQIAYGVPIFVSNLGGAMELCNNADFVFEAGDKDDFLDKLCQIINHRNKLEEFWEYSKKLITMDEHINELEGYYYEVGS